MKLYCGVILGLIVSIMTSPMESMDIQFGIAQSILAFAVVGYMTRKMDYQREVLELVSYMFYAIPVIFIFSDMTIAANYTKAALCVLTGIIVDVGIEKLLKKEWGSEKTRL